MPERVTFRWSKFGWVTCNGGISVWFFGRYITIIVGRLRPVIVEKLES